MGKCLNVHPMATGQRELWPGIMLKGSWLSDSGSSSLVANNASGRTEWAIDVIAVTHENLQPLATEARQRPPFRRCAAPR